MVAEETGPGGEVKLLLILALSCSGLQQARPACERVRSALPRQSQAYDLDSTDSRLVRWLNAAKGSHRSGTLLRNLDHMTARRGFSARLATERGFAYLTEGRTAEALAEFLEAAQADSKWPTPAKAAIVSFALLWPELTDAQRKDGYEAMLGALGERFESAVVRISE